MIVTHLLIGLRNKIRSYDQFYLRHDNIDVKQDSIDLTLLSYFGYFNIILNTKLTEGSIKLPLRQDGKQIPI